MGKINTRFSQQKRILETLSLRSHGPNARDQVLTDAFHLVQPGFSSREPRPPPPPTLFGIGREWPADSVRHWDARLEPSQSWGGTVGVSEPNVF